MAKRISKNKSNSKDTDLVNGLAKDILSRMLIECEVKTSEDLDNDAIVVDIDAKKESGLLIGARGKTLWALQTLIGLMYRGNTGDWKRIIVNVSDWRQREEERLNKMAQSTAQRAQESGQTQYLYNLTPSQRRVIHLALADNKKVTTESQGEGSGRYLIVSPKK